VIAGRTISPETRVVSFVARSLDRLRGFDRFLDLSSRLIDERSNVLCVAVGESTVTRMLDVNCYGKEYAVEILGQTDLSDPTRLWSVGAVSPEVVAEVLAATDLHVVPSRAYPVSRSTLEALASGAVVLAWESDPIREVIERDRTGLLVPADDMDAAVRAALAALDDPGAHRPLGDAAVELVRERYDRDVTLPRLAALLSQQSRPGFQPAQFD
jgi:glycosyltransferase involved in cell wall biosynthesis